MVNKLKKISVSLIIPVYNEGEKLALSLENALSVTAKIKCELIIVNDGSTDNSLNIINRFSKKNKKVRVLSFKENKGRGFAISKGFGIARGDYLIYFDSDMIMTKETILRFKKELEKNEVVIGSKKESDYFQKLPFLRKILSNCYNFLANMLIDRNMTEFQCGLKGIRKESYLKIQNFMSEKGWSWDTEFIMYAGLSGLKIKEVKINLKFLKRTSKVNMIADSFRMGLNLARIWLKKKNYTNLRLFFDSKARKYSEQRYNWFKKIFQKESVDFVAAINPKKKERILDLGCGDGYYSSIMKDYNAAVYGIDASKSMIMKLNNKGIEGEVANIENFNLKKRFDKVIISGSLEFCQNPAESLKNARAHLKKKGNAIILFPRKSAIGNLYSLFYLIKGIKITTFTEKNIRNMLVYSGFKNLEIKRSTILTSIAVCEN